MNRKQRVLQLVTVQVPIVSESECRAQNPGITVDMLCAGGEQGKDACQVSNILYITLLRQEGSIKPHLTNSVPTQGF